MKKKPKIILFIIILIICCIGAISVLFFNSNQFKQQVAQIVSYQVEKTLGNKFNIDSIEVVSFNSARIDDVELYDKQNNLIAKADKVVFTVDFWDIVTKSPLAGISEIDVQNADVLIEKRNDGTWNYEDLLDKNSDTQVDFKGDVKVSDSDLTLRLEGKQISVDKVNFLADCTDIKAIEVDGSFKHNDAKVKVSGTVGSNENTKLEVIANDLNILDYISFIPEEQLANVNLKSGYIDKADITISADFKDGYLLNGSIKFKDGACEISGYDIEAIDGIILLNNNDMQLFVKGNSNGQTVSVHGKVKNYISEPDLHLIAESKKFAPEAFLADSPFKGNISFISAIYGKLDNLKIGAEIKSDRASLYGYDISDIVIQARYADNSLFVDDLTADFAIGWLWASGQCNLSDLSYKGSFKASNIDLSILREYVPDITGTLVVRGDFKGAGLDFAGLNASGRLEVEKGSYQDIPIEKVEASFYKEGDNLQVDAMTATFANGSKIAGKGGLVDNKLDVNFYASDVDLSLVEKYAPQVQAQGNANFSGHLFGNTDNPVLQIDLMAKDGSIMHQPFDSVVVSAIGNLDGMRIDKALLIKDGVLVQEATGLFGFKGKQFIDMTVKTHKARMENLIAVAMPELKLTGNVDDTIHLTGSLAELKAEGNLHFYEGSLNGILISEINGSYEYVNGNTYLKDFKIMSPFLKASLNGSIDSENSMDFDFKADEILIDKLQVELPYPVSGKASFDGKLNGKVGALNFDGILTADEIVLNGQKIEDIYGRLLLANRILTLDKFSFKQNEGSFNFNGKVNLNTKEVQGYADIDNADINAGMAMANLENNILKGLFSGEATLYGTYEHPHIDLKGRMPSGNLKDYPLQNIQIDAELDDTIIKINRFYGEQGNGKMAAEGSVDLSNEILDGRISASNMDVNLLTHLCDLDWKINGIMNGDVQIGGTLDSPTANITISTQGDGVQFDTAYLLANLKDNVIYINQAAATKGDCAVKAEGNIPLAALDISKRTTDSLNKSMNLKLYLENADLNILPSFTPYVDWSMGNVQGDLNITGTVQNPHFNGSIATKDSAIKFKYVDSPIQNINADIDFNNQLMTIKEFNGVVGNGTFDLLGSANLSMAGVTNYNFNLNLNQLNIVSDYYTGPLNGSMQINEVDFFNKKMPKLTVNLDFNDITVAMPPLPETDDSPLPDMVLDVNVNLGDNVHAYDSLLYDLYLQGGFNIKGTTRHPQSSGTLTVKNGTINVLKTIFKIQQGDIVFNQVDSFFPTVDFLAVTRLDRAKVFVTVKGAVDKNLSTKVFSEPQMSEAEIIKLLAFRTDYKKGDKSDEITEEDLLSFATVGLQMSFLNEVEGTLRNVLNLDEFRISRDTLSESSKQRYNVDDGEVYNIEIGKYLSDKVMLKYTQGINYDLNRIGINYYMNSNVSVATEAENDGVYNVKLEMEWKF